MPFPPAKGPLRGAVAGRAYTPQADQVLPWGVIMTTQRLRALVSAALTVSLVACGSVSPEPTSSPGGSEPPPTAATMVVGVHIPVEQALGKAFDRTPTDLPLYSLHPNGSLWDPVIRRFVYSGVYRLDDTLSPVPDLAASPCAVSSDLLVITCELRDANFHDGTPVTADDVAFTYQLLMSPHCRMPALCTVDFESRLVEATAIDQRTVEFRLTEPDPGFITTLLPDVMIEPRDRVEHAYSKFVEGSRGFDPDVSREIADLIAAAVRPADETECHDVEEILLAEAEDVIADAGLQLRPRDAYGIGPDGALDSCQYADYLGRVLSDTTDALTSTGVDAIAGAYRILEFPSIPVGSGPWRVVSIEQGVRMELAAFEAFHRGTPATARVDVRLIGTSAEAIEAVRTGAIDWLIDPFPTGDNLIAEGIGDAPGIDWAEYTRLAYTGLHYNLRDGRLFADENLREAIELCIDKDETVAAATGGTGVSIYSSLSPGIWAYEPDLPRPVRDTARAMELIEESGWTKGDDGVYRQGDRRLETILHVRDDQPQFIRFVELLAIQVADCGIDLTPVPVPIDHITVALDWPLTVPGSDEQWDVLLTGWLTTPDPDFVEIFHSRAITTEENPGGFNYMGYDSAENDSLLEQGRATYDQRQRARIYREWQGVVAKDRPVLFAWSSVVREPRSDRMESTHGPVKEDSNTWWWELETLFLPDDETSADS